MDNAFINKSKNFIQKLFLNELGIIQNTEYKPQMNPIELAFCKIKNLFRNMEREGKEETPSKIYESLRSISKKDYQGFILKFNSISKNGFRKKAFLRIFITLMGIIILLSQVFGFVLIYNHIKCISNIIYALRKYF